MGAEPADDLLRAGGEALAAADWERARSCFERVAASAESAEALDGLSQVAHFEGEYLSAIELKERAFAAYKDGGNRAEAADVARWLAFLHVAFHGNRAAANGWMARAEALLDGVKECAAHGWLVLDRAPFSRDSSERERLAATALEIARRHGDVDLEFGALALLGEAHVASGRVAEGMTLLDQAMAALSAGEIAGHGPAGEIYCRFLSACEHAADVTRAEQWMAVVDRAAVWSNFVPPTCRTHYGGLLIALGRWAEAEEELLTALSAFESGYRASRVLPLVRLVELRLRQGRWEEAERLLEGNEWHPSARRSLARIALARGELARAEELTCICLDGVDSSDLACASLLDLLVDVLLARDDLAGATEALDRLAALAAGSGDEGVAASAEFAAGRVRAAEGDERASSHLRAALERFSALELPLEAARARLEFARVLAPEAPDAAVSEARLALRAFERLGAVRDADSAGELLRGLGASGRAWPRRHGTLTKRETEVLSLLAAGLSNAEIGDRLHISTRTAEHHVASILSKLGLPSRAKAAAYAVQRSPETPVAQ